VPRPKITTQAFLSRLPLFEELAPEDHVHRHGADGVLLGQVEEALEQREIVLGVVDRELGPRGRGPADAGAADLLGAARELVEAGQRALGGAQDFEAVERRDARLRLIHIDARVRDHGALSGGADREAEGEALGLDVEVRQTDAEHEMLGWLHAAADEQAPVVLNPGAWSHTSIALRDALAGLNAPLVEVHITNIHAREEFRHHSYVSGVADGVIAGLGVSGYILALGWLAQQGVA